MEEYSLEAGELQNPKTHTGFWERRSFHDFEIVLQLKEQKTPENFSKKSRVDEQH